MQIVSISHPPSGYDSAFADSGFWPHKYVSIGDIVTDRAGTRWRIESTYRDGAVEATDDETGSVITIDADSIIAASCRNPFYRTISMLNALVDRTRTMISQLRATPEDSLYIERAEFIASLMSMDTDLVVRELDMLRFALPPTRADDDGDYSYHFDMSVYDDRRLRDDDPNHYDDVLAKTKLRALMPDNFTVDDVTRKVLYMGPSRIGRTYKIEYDTDLMYLYRLFEHDYWHLEAIVRAPARSWKKTLDCHVIGGDGLEYVAPANHENNGEIFSAA